MGGGGGGVPMIDRKLHDLLTQAADRLLIGLGKGFVGIQAENEALSGRIRDELARRRLV